MTDKVRIYFLVTKEEREWIHRLAKLSRNAIPAMLIDLLEGLSRVYGIPIPTHPRRIQSYTQAASTNKARFMKRIDKELGL